MKSVLSLIGIVFFLSSCNIQKATSEYTYWVNSRKVNCEGVAPTKCLLVQKGESLDDAKWENFYSEIEGFKFEDGYLYKLLVKEENLSSDQVPADASSIKYTLVKMLEKKADPISRLHDIWALESINGESINIKGKRPILEINLSTMMVGGNNGCNSYGGKIKHVDNDRLEFGPIASTRRMCQDMDVPDKFDIAMVNTRKYKLDELKLFLLDETGNVLLQFKKVD
ncbi:DUF4377 domain-containing protein [Marinifilum flexuosum]|uniref:DUF4377 domain-containing protein n=1 Tax=Marinifilum flexuosum TaxID=1117708 RepID=UPI002492BD8D|nr:DUF4377 domain-containing protein [Marinifilum flexuosum]